MLTYFHPIYIIATPHVSPPFILNGATRLPKTAQQSDMKCIYNKLCMFTARFFPNFKLILSVHPWQIPCLPPCTDPEQLVEDYRGGGGWRSGKEGNHSQAAISGPGNRGSCITIYRFTWNVTLSEQAAFILLRELELISLDQQKTPPLAVICY